MTSKHSRLTMLTVATLAVLAASEAGAQNSTSGEIKISTPWTRATPKGARVAGGFMVIENKGKESDYLTGGTFSRSGRVEIHEMAIVKDVMWMRELPNGLEVKPGQKVVLKPGSYHVMFMELKQPLQSGESIEGTLKFKNAGEISVKYRVEAMGRKGSGSPSKGSH